NRAVAGICVAAIRRTDAASCVGDHVINHPMSMGDAMMLGRGRCRTILRHNKRSSTRQSASHLFRPLQSPGAPTVFLGYRDGRTETSIDLLLVFAPTSQS